GYGDAFNAPAALSPVPEVVRHPGYEPNVASPDMALLRLERPLPARFTPAFLGARAPDKGEDLIAVGYGKSSPNDATAGSVLRMVVLRVATTYSGFLSLASARDGDSGGRPRDSGGPVFAYRGLYALVGIISGSSGRETFVVSIAPNYAWIKETMEKLGAS